MNKKEQEILIHEDGPIDSIRGFCADEMSKCPACDRANGPNRLKCIYCGGQLEISSTHAGHIRLKASLLESWQKGWNIILLPDQCIDASTVAKIAQEFSLDIGYFQKVVASSRPLPLASLDSESEAAIWGKRFESLGVAAKIVGDEELLVEKLPRRLRGIRFLGSEFELIDFNTQALTCVSYENLRTIVTGILFEDRSETPVNRRRSKSEATEESVNYRDEPVIDIYFDNDQLGYRMLSSGFDFSCLGNKKSRLAAENFQMLIQQLSLVSPRARVITSYRESRSLLSGVWAYDLRQNIGERQRRRLFTAESKKSITRSNVSQFTRFSRLQNLL